MQRLQPFQAESLGQFHLGRRVRPFPVALLDRAGALGGWGELGRAGGALAGAAAGEVLEEAHVGGDGVDGFGWGWGWGARADPGAFGGVGHGCCWDGWVSVRVGEREDGGRWGCYELCRNRVGKKRSGVVNGSRVTMMGGDL